MSRLVSSCSAAALLVCAAGVASVQAGHRAVTLAVIMTNDPMSNQIKVYDVDHHVLLQTLSTHGKGGVGGNARGVKQYNGELFAAVNNGSNTVAVYRRDGNRLRFDKLVTTTSAPGERGLWATIICTWPGRRRSIHSSFIGTAWNGWMARPRWNWLEAALRPMAARHRSA